MKNDKTVDSFYPLKLSHFSAIYLLENKNKKTENSYFDRLDRKQAEFWCIIKKIDDLMKNDKTVDSFYQLNILHFSAIQ